MSGIAQKILGNPEKYSVQELTQGVQSGVIPGYIGIPLIQDKMQKQKEAQAIAGGPRQEQPPIAAQVLAQAQGVPSLSSNLPQEYAGGGIVAFSSGGSSAKALLGDEEDDDYTDAVMSAMDSLDAMRSHIGALRETGISPSESSGLAALLPPHLGGQNDQSMQVAYNGPGSGLIDSVRSYFSKTPEPAATPRQVPASNFQHALNFILPHEGGYVNDKADRGGPTKYGVTKNTLEGYLGKKVSTEDVQNMPLDLAKQIYKEQYWDKIGGDKLDPKIAMLAFDTAVGSGVGKAKQMLAKYGDDPEKFLEAKKQWMKDIVGRDPSQKKFDKGWQNRMNNLGEYIQTLPSDLNVASMAAGGVAHFDGGGISDIFNMSSDEIKDLMRRRLRMEQARSALSGVPEAAAPAEGIKGLSPAANQARPSMGSTMGSAITRALSGITGPLAATTAAGAVPTALAGNYLSRLPTESLDTLSGDIGSDTGLAAAIMSQGRQTPQAAPAARPVASPMIPSGAGAGRGKQGGPTAEQLRRAAFEQNIGNTQDTEDMDAGINALPAAQASPVAQPTAEAAPAEDTMAALRKQISESLSGLKSQAEQDKYLSLLQAGLGMLGGTSPFAAANIGQGAMQGVNTYAALAKQRGDEQKGLLSAQLGLERYGQLGALTKEQMALRKELAAQEDLRKRELAGAAIEEKAARRGISEEKMYADRLAQMEKLAQNEALAKFKGAILPEEKERIFAQALTGLRADPAYRKLYSRVHGMDPGGSILTYDPASRSVR
jgi:hypothetical protein